MNQSYTPQFPFSASLVTALRMVSTSRLFRSVPPVRVLIHALSSRKFPSCLRMRFWRISGLLMSRSSRLS